jgi:hypothetical protein
MVQLLNPFRSRKTTTRPDVVIPLRSVRPHQGDESATGNGADETTGDGEEGDIEPLLPSDGSALERLRSEIERDLSTSGVDSAYDRKSKVINKAIQDIGMGRYQWELFMLCGMGWLADK